MKTSGRRLQLREEKRDPSPLRSASSRDHVAVPQVALAASIRLPLAKPPVASGEASLAFLPLPAPTPLGPGAEFWPVSRGVKWPVSLPGEPEAHYEKLF